MLLALEVAMRCDLGIPLFCVGIGLPPPWKICKEAGKDGGPGEAPQCAQPPLPQPVVHLQLGS